MREEFRIKPYKHPRLKFVVRSKMNGKWVRKYFATKVEAKTYCDRRNIEMKNQGRESLEFPSWLRVMAERANERLAQHGKTIEDAVSFYVQHLAKLKRSLPLKEAMEELIENRRASGSTEIYCYDIGLRLGRLCREFPDRNTEEISSRELDEWLAGLNLAPVTRNTFRRDLHTLFAFCVSRGYASTNPVEGTRNAKEVSQPVGILNVDETTRFLNAVPEKLIPYSATPTDHSSGRVQFISRVRPPVPRRQPHPHL